MREFSRLPKPGEAEGFGECAGRGGKEAAEASVPASAIDSVPYAIRDSYFPDEPEKLGFGSFLSGFIGLGL